MRKFWWAGVQEENQTTPIPFRSWEDICKPTQQGGLGIRDLELVNQSLLINSAWNIATEKKTLCFLIFLRPNTILLLPSGKPVLMSPNPYIGLPFSKSDTTSTPMSSTKFTMATPLFGLSRGAPCGKIFMTPYPCLLLTTLCQQKFLIFGIRTPKPGITIFLPPLSVTGLFTILNLPLLSLILIMIFSGGLQPKMEFVLLKLHTPIYVLCRYTSFQTKDPEAYQSKPTKFFIAPRSVS